MVRVTDYLTQDEILAAVAEEAAEVAQAALKYRRAITGVSPTPQTAEDALYALTEEIADLDCCLNQLTDINWDVVNQIHDKKLIRWLDRLAKRDSL